GGAGPVHALNLADLLEIRHVLVPPTAGLFSAIGLLLSRHHSHYTRSFHAPLTESILTNIHKEFVALEEKARVELQEYEKRPSRLVFEPALDLRYVGQGHELTILSPQAGDDRMGDDRSIRTLVKAFEDEHEATFGHTFRGNQLEVVALRL